MGSGRCEGALDDDGRENQEKYRRAVFFPGNGTEKHKIPVNLPDFKFHLVALLLARYRGNALDRRREMMTAWERFLLT